MERTPWEEVKRPERTERLEGENLALFAYETAPPEIGSVNWKGWDKWGSSYEESSDHSQSDRKPRSDEEAVIMEETKRRSQEK